jgi:hypothetical protein
MATVNPALPSPQRTRRRALLFGLVLIAGLVATFWGPLNGYAMAGTAYGARVACSCKFVGGRSLEDCRKDFEPKMELIMLSEDSEAKSVTATFPLLARQTARLVPGEGCRLDPWEG